MEKTKLFGNDIDPENNPFSLNTKPLDIDLE